ncbi:MAG TPA: protein kinase [Gammaproteobacteria bacterium]|nr:protein kinase [Gammaproteobacteria bacterium]
MEEKKKILGKSQEITSDESPSIVMEFAIKNREKFIGKGGRSTIILRSKNDELLAIKVMGLTAEPPVQEAKMWKAAQGVSSRVISLKKADDDALVMGLMVNGSLYELLKSDDILPWSLRLSIAIDIAQAIEDLYKNDIVHGDIKSLNILLSSDWRAMLTDFGNSCFVGEKSKEVKVSTPEWQGPEVWTKNGYCKASDIYSFGVVLWELVTRSLPYKELSREQVAKTIVIDKKTNPIPKNCPCPLRLENIIKSCWHLEPQQRPSASQLKTSLMLLWQECTMGKIWQDDTKRQPPTGKLRKSASVPNLRIPNSACSPGFFDHASVPIATFHINSEVQENIKQQLIALKK